MATAQPKANRRYVERTVIELKTGDVFTLDGGATYHECAVNLCATGTIAVAHDSGQTVRIDVEGTDQPCTVQVDYVRVRIVLPLDVDVAAWNEIYGSEGATAAEVRVDVKNYFDPNSLIPNHLTDIVKVAAADPFGPPEAQIEYFCAVSDDWWECPCGNSPDGTGLVIAMSDGTPSDSDPTYASHQTLVCLECGRYAIPVYHTVDGQRVTTVRGRRDVGEVQAAARREGLV
jgi:hypothetical protein